MNEVLNAILSRRGIKQYEEKAVPKELLEQVIEAGIWAPSGMNKQPVIILAITNRDEVKKLSETNREIMGVEFDPFYGAQTVLVVLADKTSGTYLYDGSLAMGNMMIAAQGLGLGTRWIHRARETFERQEWKDYLKNLGIEGDYEGIGNLIIGYADGDIPAPRERAEGRVYKI